MQDSIVTGSPNIGVLANNPTTTPSQVTISRSLVSSNHYGVYVDGNNGDCCNAIADISDSSISSNDVGIHVAGDGSTGTGTAHLKHNMFAAYGVGVEIVSAGVAVADDNYLFSDTTLLDLDFKTGA